MPYLAPDAQETFNREVVEAVTGIKAATFRQWETRDIYICELRRAAEFEMHVTCAPDSPDRIPRSAEILKKYQHGWRAYTIGDLVRIAYIKALMDVGFDAKEAGRAATAVSLPEAIVGSVPSGRELIRLQNPRNDPNAPDELVVFAPGWGKPLQIRLAKPTTQVGVSPDIILLFAGQAWENLFGADGALAWLGPNAAVLVNLSEIRRDVLNRLESRESKRVKRGRRRASE